jgi:hypothetical protein
MTKMTGHLDVEKSHESHSLGFERKEFPGLGGRVDQNRSFPIETDQSRSILDFFRRRMDFNAKAQRRQGAGSTDPLNRRSQR